jgi:hypothetical protein
MAQNLKNLKLVVAQAPWNLKLVVAQAPWNLKLVGVATVRPCQVG